MDRLSRILVATVIIVGLAGGIAVAQTTSKTVSGEITKVNLKEQTLSVRDAKTGKLQRYRAEPDTEFTMRGKTVGLSQLRPGYDATLVVRETTDGLPVIIAVRMPNVVVDVPATANAVSTRTVTGEITKVNLKERTLSLREAKSGKLQRYRVEPNTEFTMRGKTAGLSQVRPGFDATVVVRETAEGLPVIVQVRMPNAPAPAPATPPVVAKNSPVKPAPPVTTPKPAAPKPAPMPTRLPNTGGPLPLIGLLGAGALALASGLRAFRSRGSRHQG